MTIKEQAGQLPYLAFEDYAKHPAVNASFLVHAERKSWRSAYLYRIGHGPDQTVAMGTGIKHHEMIIEPEVFEDTFVVMPNFAIMEGNVDKKGNSSTSWATSFCKSGKAAFEAEAILNDKKVITRQEYDDGLAMCDSIANNKVAARLVADSAPEVSLFGEIEGVECKCRIDLCGEAISDIKGTVDASQFRFGNSAAGLHYTFKLALYRELYAQNFDKLPNVMLIAVESKQDHECAVYEIPVSVLDDKIVSVKQRLRQYKTCVETKTWPGVDKNQTEPIPLFIPNWAMDADDGLDWSDTDD